MPEHRRIGQYHLLSEAPDLVLRSRHRISIRFFRSMLVLLVLGLPATLATLVPPLGAIALILLMIFLAVLTTFHAARQADPDLLIDPVFRIEVRAAAEAGYRDLADQSLLFVNGRRFESRQVKQLPIKVVNNPRGPDAYNLYLVLDRTVIKLDSARDPHDLTPLRELLLKRLRREDEAVSIQPEVPAWGAVFAMVGLIVLEASAAVVGAMAPITFLSAIPLVSGFLIVSAAIVVLDWIVAVLIARSMRASLKRYLATNFAQMRKVA